MAQPPVPPYVVEISKLAEGQHHITFHVGNDLFADAPETGILAADVQVAVVLDKTTRHLDLRLLLTGHVSVPCDRCLTPFSLPIHSEQRRIFSHDPATEASDDDTLSYLPRETHLLDLAADLYDFVALCVPLRRVPPDCPSDVCPPEMLAYLGESSEEASESAFARQLKQKLGADTSPNE